MLVRREEAQPAEPVRDALQGDVLDQALVGVKVIADPLHVDPAHLLAVLASICWFPYAHANTLPKAFGLDPYAAESASSTGRAGVELLLARSPDWRRDA